MRVAGPIRLLVVDDHLVVREGARLLVQRDPTITIAGYAPTAREALALAKRIRPEVVLLDLRLPDMLAPEAVRSLRAVAPTSKVLLFTAHAQHAGIEAALAAGAHGCLLKDAGQTDLLHAIKCVARGQRVVDPRIDAERTVGGVVGDLTPREYEVLRRVALGETNPEIADALTLSRNTVKSYLQSAMQKLGARNRVDAIVRAGERGLL